MYFYALFWNINHMYLLQILLSTSSIWFWSPIYLHKVSPLLSYLDETLYSQAWRLVLWGATKGTALRAGRADDDRGKPGPVGRGPGRGWGEDDLSSLSCLWATLSRSSSFNSSRKAQKVLFFLLHDDEIVTASVLLWFSVVISTARQVSQPHPSFPPTFTALVLHVPSTVLGFSRTVEGLIDFLPCLWAPKWTATISHVLREDTRLLCQRQRTTSLTAQQAVLALCLHWLPVLTSSHGGTAHTADLCYSWETMSLGTFAILKALVQNLSNLIPTGKYYHYHLGQKTNLSSATRVLTFLPSKAVCYTNILQNIIWDKSSHDCVQHYRALLLKESFIFTCGDTF